MGVATLARFRLIVPTGETAAGAVHALEAAAPELASLGVRIERVRTDNGGEYRAHACQDAVAGLGARHKRTRPWRPQTNGKAERLIQTLLREWAHGRPYRSNDERADALRPFVDFCSRGRPHTALGGRSPLDAAYLAWLTRHPGPSLLP